MRIRRLVALAIVTALLLSAMPVSAHDPHFEINDWGGIDNPYVIPYDPTVSFAMYAYLSDHDTDAIALDFKNAGDQLQAQLLVPICGKHYLDFYPQMAIVGPGLPVPSDLKTLPFDLPTGMGAQIIEMDQPDANSKRPTLYEDIGATTFYTAPEVKMKVAQAGRYYIVAWDKAGQTGDYTIATGYKEQSVSPLPYVLSSIVLIRANHWLHRDCQKDPGDPAAIIQPDFKSVPDPFLPPATAVATTAATMSATAQTQ